MRGIQTIMVLFLIGLFPIQSEAEGPGGSQDDLAVVRQLLADLKVDSEKTEAWPALKLTAGRAVRSGRMLCLMVDDQALKQGKIEFPRLNNTLRRVFQPSAAESTGIKFRQSPSLWTVDLSGLDRSVSPLVVILEFETAPYFSKWPHINTADEDDRIRMPAHHAEVHGEKLQFEPLPHKNTIGYWVNVKDWAEWRFAVAKPGDYDVYVFQGCGKGQGGSEVDIVVDDQRIQFEVVDTGHFQNFRWRQLGTVTLAGKTVRSLQVRPQRIARNAVMDIREIRLVPKGTGLGIREEAEKEKDGS